MCKWMDSRSGEGEASSRASTRRMARQLDRVEKRKGVVGKAGVPKVFVLMLAEEELCKLKEEKKQNENEN